MQGGGVYISSGDVTFNSCDIHDNMATRDVRSPLAIHRPPLDLGNRRPASLVSQGGGVYVHGGDVSFFSCDIHDNTVASSVRTPLTC